MEQYNGDWWRQAVERVPVQEAAPEKEVYNEEVVCVNSFDDMGLSDNVLRGIYAYGFETPSQVQQIAIVPILNGRDVVIQSHSGTGKTAAFAIPALQKIDYSLDKPNKNKESNKSPVQVIILTSTRELASQIFSVVQSLADYTAARVQLCAGGNSVRDDILGLRNNAPHIVVGVGGRVLDMMNREAVLDPSQVSLLVIDEGDDLLSASKAPLMGDIVMSLPTSCQIAVFGSTLRSEHVKTANKAAKDPLVWRVKKSELFLEGWRHFIIPCNAKCEPSSDDYASERLEALIQLFTRISFAQAIVFCTKKKTAEWLDENMKKANFSSNVHHGDLDSSERMRVLKLLRSADIRFLIATDALARGIDLHTVSLVINFDFPPDASNKTCLDMYYHRAGRAGRFGRRACVLNLVASPNDMNYLENLRSRYSLQPFEEIPLDQTERLSQYL